MLPSRRVLACALLALLTAPAARAQLVYTIDAAGTTASYDDSPSASGFSLSPGIRLNLPNASLVASSGFSLFDGGEWTAQGFLGGSIFTPSAHGFRAELAATASGIAYTGHGRSAYVVGQSRIHFTGDGAGVWAGGGLGHTRSHESGSRLVIADAGAWVRSRGLTLSASFTESRFHSGATTGEVSQLMAPWQFTFDAAVPPRPARDRVLDDAVLTAHWEIGVFDVDASAGARFRSRTDPAQQWGTLGGTFWMTPTLGLVASGGTYPESYIQGFPSTHYANVGLRFVSSSRRSPAKVRAAGVHAPERPVNAARRFAVIGSGAERTIRVVIPGAEQVELIADFTGWLPATLERVAPDTWELRTQLAPGTYRVSIRVDGGAWRAPPGIPARANEFGSDAGVVVVE